MTVSLVVAMAQNGVIGSHNDLPWYLPADLKRFKELTTGHSVIMGRKTFESIIKRLGKPLPNRRNLVISRQADFHTEGADIYSDLEKALGACVAEKEVFVIGGAQIFELALPQASKIYLTNVLAHIEGDVYFPKLNTEEWDTKILERHKKDDKNQYDFEFRLLTRKHHA